MASVSESHTFPTDPDGIGWNRSCKLDSSVAFWGKWLVPRGYTLNNVRNPHGQRDHAAIAAVKELQQIDETVLH